MKVLFKNKTTYTKQVYIEYHEFHNKKFGKKQIIYTVVISILLLFCIVLNLIYSKIPIALIFVLILIGFVWYRIYYPKKQVLNQMKEHSNKEYTFTFYNSYMTIENEKEKYKYNYWKLHRLCQNRKYFYLYVDNCHAFILQKNMFTTGNVKDFNKFIRKKTLFSFIRFLRR